MIPDFILLPGVPFGVLPPGIHWTDLAEIQARFAFNDHRLWLFEGIVAVAAALRYAGCRAMYLDGSYVTAKDRPQDFDGCWDPAGVSSARLDPVLLDFADGRREQKRKYRGEMFVSTSVNGAAGTFLEFFQREKITGKQKGIVGLRLEPAKGPV